MTEAAKKFNGSDFKYADKMKEAADAAKKAAYEHVFEPALQNDVPVKATICLKFRFSLTE